MDAIADALVAAGATPPPVVLDVLDAIERAVLGEAPLFRALLRP